MAKEMTERADGNVSTESPRPGSTDLELGTQKMASSNLGKQQPTDHNTYPQKAKEPTKKHTLMPNTKGRFFFVGLNLLLLVPLLACGGLLIP